MPTIVKIGNVSIRMFADDHNPPHFHVVTGDQQIAIAIRDLSPLAGSMNRKSLTIALEWAAINKDRLYDEWNRLNP